MADSKIIDSLSNLYGDFLNPTQLAKFYQENGFDSQGNFSVDAKLLEIMLHRNERNKKTYNSMFDRPPVNVGSQQVPTRQGIINQIKSLTDASNNQLVDKEVVIFGRDKNNNRLTFFGKSLIDKQDPLKGNNGTIEQNTDIQKILDTGNRILQDTKKSATVVLCNTAFVSPAMNSTADVSSFFNSIPNLHLARCQHYLQVEVLFRRKTIGPTNVLKTPSVLKFLLGAVNPPGQVDKAIKNFSELSFEEKEKIQDPQGNSAEVWQSITQSSAGMEIFTSPVTLVPYETKNANTLGANRTTEIRDKFLPLASVDKVVVQQRPSGFGTITYPTAKMEIKVHDRTRLAELSDMLRPEYFSAATIKLNYGLQYSRRPDEVDNAYKKFIDENMQITDVYRISNSSYSFTEDNGVKITLELISLNSEKLYELQILDGSESASNIKNLLELRNALERILRESEGQDRPGFAEIRKSQFINDISSGIFKSISAVDLFNLRTLLAIYAQRENKNLVDIIDQLEKVLDGQKVQQKPDGKSGTTEPDAAKDPAVESKESGLYLENMFREYIKDKLYRRRPADIAANIASNVQTAGGLISKTAQTPTPAAAPTGPAVTSGDKAPVTQNNTIKAAQIRLRLTAYYPYAAKLTPEQQKMEGGTRDRKKRKLYTLQMHLADPVKYPWVSLAGDFNVFPDGQRIVIDSINQHFGKDIVFRVVDTGGHFYDHINKKTGQFEQKVIRVAGAEPIDVCVADRNDPDFAMFAGKIFSAKVVLGDYFATKKSIQKFNPHRAAPGSVSDDTITTLSTRDEIAAAKELGKGNITQDPSKESVGARYDTFLALYELDSKNIFEAVKNTQPPPGRSYTVNNVIDSDINIFSVSQLGVSDRFASFGYIFTTFVCPPLIRNGDFDELQVFFYTFNDKAGTVRGMNISEFPIMIEDFAARWASMLAGTRDNPQHLSMPLAPFINDVLLPALNDPFAPPYGNFSDYKLDPKTGLMTPNPDVSKDANIKARSSERIERIQSAFGQHRLPRIEVYFETLTGDDGSLIHRIHVYDAVQEPFPIFSELIEDGSGNLLAIPDKSRIDKYLRSVVQDATKNNKTTPNSEQVFDALKSQKIIKSVPIRAGDAEGLKSYIARTMPFIRYGTSASAIRNATLQSEASAELSTIQIFKQQAGTNPTSPNNAAAGGFPLRIIPAKLTMTTVGCPQLRAAQKYFVDFNTGTTVDNVYMVKEIMHNISPGNFSSQLTLLPTDGYPIMSTTGDFKAQLIRSINGIKKQIEEQKAATAAADRRAAEEADEAARKKAQDAHSAMHYNPHYDIVVDENGKKQITVFGGG